MSGTAQTPDAEGIDKRLRQITDATAEATSAAEEGAGKLAAAVETGVRNANAGLRRRSDGSLALVGALSAGLAGGLLLAGSNRLLIAAALVPAAMIAGIGFERVDRLAKAEEAATED